MKKIIHIAFFSIFLFPMSESLNGQSRNTGWQLSLGGGFMNYYGDISPYRIQKWSDWQDVFNFFQYNQYYIPKTSLGISLEKRFTPGVGIMLQANEGAFSMSDRYRYGNGNYDYNAPHWDRTLNFETNIWDAGLALTFHSDNDRFLYSNSFLAPYFFIGGGITYFQVYGDLYDSSGNPYNYADPNVHPDGPFNINLRPLVTETNKEFPDVVPYVDLGIGIKLRFSKVASLTVQSDIKYSFSDYLDDVSGKYKTHYATAEQALAAHPGINVIGSDRNRGYNDGVNDLYIFNKASLQFSFGSRSAHPHFKAPVVYNPGLISSAKMMSQIDTFSHAKNDSLNNARLQDSLHIIRRQDSLKQMMAKHTASDSVLNILRQLQAEILALRFTHIDQDYLIRQNETEYSIHSLEDKRRILGSKLHLTKLGKMKLELDQIKIDSLKIQWQAIQKAREQLRRDMAHTPIVTEYADSTKIMIYKGKGAPLENYLPLIDSQKILPDTSSYLNEDINKEQTAQESLQYKQESSQYKLDSLLRVQDSLLSNYQNMSMDSLQNIIDSTSQQPPNSSFFQRFFDKFRKNKQFKNTHQYTIAQQQQLINYNRKEIDRLNDEIKVLRTNNQRYNAGISRADKRNERMERMYLEESIAGMNRDRRRQNRVEIIPQIVPAITVGGGRENNKHYEDQLKDIRQKLDSIQAQQEKPPVQQTHADSLAVVGEVDSLRHQLDSLRKLQAKEQQVKTDNQIATLEQQVDSLHRQISHLKNEQITTLKTDKENYSNAIANFPVISAYFATGSSSLSNAQINKLSPAAMMTKNNPDVTILLKGYTDGTGNASINKIISQKRCQFVRNIFIHQFNIDPSNIEIDAIGETPLAGGENPMQRRVDIILKQRVIHEGNR